MQDLFDEVSLRFKGPLSIVSADVAIHPESGDLTNRRTVQSCMRMNWEWLIIRGPREASFVRHGALPAPASRPREATSLVPFAARWNPEAYQASLLANGSKCC